MIEIKVLTKFRTIFFRLQDTWCVSPIMHLVVIKGPKFIISYTSY